MPLIIILLLLIDILSVAFFGLDIFLWREWFGFKDTADDEYARRCLYGAIALLLYIGSGRSLIKMLLSTRRKGEDEPKQERSEDWEEIRRSDNSLIHIEHYGDKTEDAIVFLHGWNSNSMQWYYQKKAFAKKHHLIMVDLPGLGKSRRPLNKDFSLENMASCLNDVLERTKPKNPVIWGHSMGGMTILTYCKVYRNKLQMLKGIILQHTTYTNPTNTSIMAGLVRSIQNPILKPICWFMIALSPVLWISKWMSYLNGNSLIMSRFMTFTGTQTPQQLDFATLLSTMAPPAITGRGLLGMFKYDATGILKDINIPTLIFAANHDRLTKPDASKLMDQTITGSKLVTLKPAGHLGLIERHEEVNREASDFLGSLR